jgi:plastocyanin
MKGVTSRLRRGLRTAAAISGAATVVGVFGLASPAAAQDHVVTIDLFAFTPQAIEVTAGQTVEFVNQQTGVPHTVTDDDTGVGSPILETGESWEVMFSLPLDEPITYHCEIHPTMTGTITVIAP